MNVYWELIKPRLTLVALVVVAGAFYMASTPPMDTALLVRVILGAALVAAGGNALNQYLERDYDAKMQRTRLRPLPSGRLRAEAALAFGAAASAAGLTVLWFFVNPLTAFVGFSIFLSYVFVYTPLKRVTPLNTFVGAVPGALPMLIGWTAANPVLTPEAWTLFAILFLWQLPHFFAICWEYRQDYERAGFRMITRTDALGEKTASRILLYSALLIPASLLPYFLGMSGIFYKNAALLSGLFSLFLVHWLYRRRLEGARRFIPASIAHLVILSLCMVIDKQ